MEWFRYTLHEHIVTRTSISQLIPVTGVLG